MISTFPVPRQANQRRLRGSFGLLRRSVMGASCQMNPSAAATSRKPTKAQKNMSLVRPKASTANPTIKSSLIMPTISVLTVFVKNFGQFHFDRSDFDFPGFAVVVVFDLFFRHRPERSHPRESCGRTLYLGPVGLVGIERIIDHDCAVAACASSERPCCGDGVWRRGEHSDVPAAVHASAHARSDLSRS